MRRRILLPVAALALAAWSGVSHAHRPSDSYLTVRADDQRVEVRVDLALRDLHRLFDLDANGDGDITWGELRGRHADITGYVARRLAIQQDDRSCPLHDYEHRVARHGDDMYAVLSAPAQCHAVPDVLGVSYDLLFEVDPLHRALVVVEHAGRTHTAILGPDQRQRRFELDRPSRWRAFADYFGEGVHHIWIGADHILFLLALLLAAVLEPAHRRWIPDRGLRSIAGEIAAIVTAFTVAHSITLTASALGWLSLPSRWVEVAIALSVAAAALGNLVPRAPHRWSVAFAFGLLHGFGFAGALSGLVMAAPDRTVALVGFNLGVEVGQLAIVAVFVPIAFGLRGWSAYRRVVVPGGSLAIAAMALVWAVQRL